MGNGIAILTLLAILGGAAGYIRRAKQRGQKCIGCPYARECGGRCAGKET